MLVFFKKVLMQTVKWLAKKRVRAYVTLTIT